MIQEEKMELQIEPTVTDELFDLEALIVDGTDNFIPLKFIYPNTDKTVGVYIRPVSTSEFTNAVRDQNNFIITILSKSLYDKNKNLIPVDVISKLPVGVGVELYKKVADISGIPTDDNEEVTKEMVNKFMGF